VGVFASHQTLGHRKAADNLRRDDAFAKLDEFELDAAMAGTESIEIDAVDLKDRALFAGEAGLLSHFPREEVLSGAARPLDLLEVVEGDHPGRGRVVDVEDWPADFSRANEPAILFALGLGDDLAKGWRHGEEQSGDSGESESHHSPHIFEKPDDRKA